MLALYPATAFCAAPQVRCENPVGNQVSYCAISWKIPDEDIFLAGKPANFNQLFLFGLGLLINDETKASNSNLGGRQNAGLPDLAKLDAYEINSALKRFHPSNANSTDWHRIEALSRKEFEQRVKSFHAHILPAMVNLDGTLFLVERIKWGGGPLSSPRFVFESADLSSIADRRKISLSYEQWSKIRYFCVKSTH
ncbi:MAG: hypothetical protein JNN20_10030 [Betaproteobacteria bacterium]|nr:hypothetical protein [Betaproteobacteria bacterium]